MSEELSLKEIKQRFRVNRDKDFTWLKRNFHSSLSIPIIKILLTWNVTANQVSIILLLIGLLGCILLTFGEYWLNIGGAFLLFLSIILDYVDGAVARAKKCVSLRGAYLERTTISVVNALSFFCISVGLYRVSHESLIMIFGFCGSISAIFNKYFYCSREVVDLIHGSPTEKGRANPVESEKRGDNHPNVMRDVIAWIKYIFSQIELLWDFSYIVLFFVIGAIFNTLSFLVVFYGITYPLLTIYIFIRNARKNMILGNNKGRILSG